MILVIDAGNSETTIGLWNGTKIVERWRATTDGSRRLFNRMEPQLFGDADLPPPQPWTNQAFAMQSVSLKSFPPGQYELEVVMRDRLTRASATGSVAFTVGVR